MTLAEQLREIATNWAQRPATFDRKAAILRAADELERLEGISKRLYAALSDLMDVQNGPPLITLEREWNEAMGAAKAVEAEYEAAAKAREETQ